MSNPLSYSKIIQNGMILPYLLNLFYKKAGNKMKTLTVLEFLCSQFGWQGGTIH
jgi:hypothetical protein